MQRLIRGRTNGVTLYKLVHLLILLCLCLDWAPVATASANGYPKLQNYLATLAEQEPTERVRVIVQLATTPTAGMKLIAQADGQVERQLALINALVAEMPAGALPRLAAAPGVKQISLDAPVTKLSEGGDGLIDVRDTFDQVAYGNNDGEGFWADAWQEVGESDGPQDGDVAVLPFWGGALQGLRLQGAERGAQRQVDVTQASAATVSLSYRRKDFRAETDVVHLAVSTDGGASWQAVGQLTGPATDAEIQYAHYDLSAFVGQPVQIRLQLASTMSADAKFYLDAINLQWTPVADATVALVRRAYLPLVASPATTVATDAGDGTVQAAVYSTAALASTYVRAIGADRLWTEAPAYLTGAGVTVAVVDSGITEHPDLRRSNGQSRILARANFVTGSSSVDDYFGHGTHVAGLIGGNGAQSGGKYMGVAPDVNLLDVKVTDDHGVGRMSDVVAGLQWVLNNKNTHNIRVVNLSLNSNVPDSYHTSPLSAAVEILWFNGIVVVVSAGNDGSYKLNSPANDPFVITVGAVDDKGTTTISDDTLAKFSSYNITEDGFAKPDLVAPGRNLVALLSADDNNLTNDFPANRLSGSERAYYYKMSGTSMASAVAAGAVALLLQDEPNLTPDQVKFRLMNTVQAFSSTQGCATGAGYLDIYAATKGSSTSSANTGVRASQLLWSGTQPVTWNSVSWNSVSWNSVSWNSVSWNSVSWNSVSWNSVSWTEDAPQFTCRDVSASNLLGHWRLDETNGRLAADASGNNNIGTFTGTLRRQNNGRRNGAAQLNGGIVHVPASTILNNLTNQLTVSAWINRSASNYTWQSIISRQFGTSWGDQFFLGVFGDTYAFIVNTPNNGNQHIEGGANPLNQWVHVAGVYNGSQITLYINGVAINSLAVSGNIRTEAKPVIIGGNVNDTDPNSADELFTGQIDDVRFYNRALTAAEISTIYTGSPVPGAPLVIYGDQLQSNWINSSWNSNVTFNNATPLFSGSNSIATTITSALGALALRANTAVSTSGYTGLRFRVHGGASNVRTLQVRFNMNGAFVTLVDLYPNQWTQVDIPFSSMGNPSTLTDIFWQDFSGGAQPIFYVDQIELVRP